MPTSHTRNERRVLAGAVSRIRKIQGLTQDQVATRAGTDDAGKRLLDHTLVSHIEAGRRRPKLEAMCALATGLGVDLDDITYMANVYVVTEDEPVSA